jgi:O-antigen ligase
MTAAAAILSAVVASVLLLVAPGAESSFDAPKRLVALLGIAVASVVVCALPWPSAPVSRSARVVAWLALAAVGGAVVAAVASPRSAVALDALRVLLVGALSLPLGASPALADGRARLPLAAFLAAATIDAVVSLLQVFGLAQPFAIEAISGRTPTGAFLGNEGMLALVMALGVVASLGVVLYERRPLPRVLAGVAGVVQLVALLANGNLTSVLVLATGGVVLLLAHAGRRALAALAAVVVALVAVVALAPPLRARIDRIVVEGREGRWDDLTSNRLGAWAAALEMIRARPLTGVGPGTFGAEFVPHRLAAEIRWRSRFVTRTLTSTFSEAHDDYLQAFAELGVPAAGAAIAAWVLLLVALARQTGPAAPEATILLAVLCGGAVAALTWFPVQRPATAVPLLLAAGRAWRLVA